MALWSNTLDLMNVEGLFNKNLYLGKPEGNSTAMEEICSNPSSPKVHLHISRIYSLKGVANLERFFADSSRECVTGDEPHDNTTDSLSLVPTNHNPKIPVIFRENSLTPPKTYLIPSFTSKRSSGMYRHEQVFRCEVCGHEFNQKGNLYTHMRIHEDKRPFQCGECGYAARQLVQLKRHAKHHTFRFQFKCRFCSYSSKMKSTTTKHCTLVHSALLGALNIDP